MSNNLKLLTSFLVMLLGAGIGYSVNEGSRVGAAMTQLNNKVLRLEQENQALRERVRRLESAQIQPEFRRETSAGTPR